MEDIINKLAEFLHSQWKKEMESEGYHLPEKCPNFEDDFDEEKETADKFLVHCRKCNMHMCSYETLEDFQKEKFLKQARDLYTDIQQFGLKIEKN